MQPSRFIGGTYARWALAAVLLLDVWLWTDPVAKGQEATAPSDTPATMASEQVDTLLSERLKDLGWQPAGDCDDASFMRRVYLDLTGGPPSGAEVMDFLEDTSQDKRAALIDRLLDSPACAAHLAEVWSGWMLPSQDNPLVRNGQQGLRSWLRDRFAENLRYDRLVSDLLVATGPAQTGPTVFFIAHEGKPEKLAAKTARVFMGVQLDCAECHDHPFDQWSQRDFWGFAAYFAQLSTGAGNAMMAAGEVMDLQEGDVTLPGSTEVIAPKPLVKTGLQSWGRGTRRQQLTLWLTARENPFLARATVNRVWALLFGQGLIEPVDDMRNLELASHPRLLADLSDHFAATGYDLKGLLRLLTNTRAYSRDTLHPNGQPPENSYAVMATKPLTEQQLARSLVQVARQIASDDDGALQQVLTSQLGQLRGDGSQAKLGIVSALVTLHGEVFDEVTRNQSSRLLKALDAPYLDARKQMRWLFLSTLNRLPSHQEEVAFSDLISRVSQPSAADADSEADLGPASVPDPSDTAGRTEPTENTDSSWLSDLLWALLNSSEFAMTP